MILIIHSIIRKFKHENFINLKGKFKINKNNLMI